MKNMNNMKITEKQWNEMAWKVAKTINSEHLDDLDGFNYYLQVSRRLFKSEVFFLGSYDYVSQEGEPTKEGRKLLEDYVLGPLVSKFFLTPGLSLLAAYKKEDSARKIKERMTSCFYQYGGLISSNGRDFTITPSALFGEGFIVFLKKGNYVTVDCIVYVPEATATVLDFIRDFRGYFKSVPKIEAQELSITVDTISAGLKGLRTNTYMIELKDKTNISRDFPNIPHTEIQNFIGSEDSGIAIFHGEPGCGKSTYLKYLMKINPDERFTVVTPDIIFSYQDAFRNYIIQSGKSRIYIIEDSEKLLIPRTNTGSTSSALSDLLNFADGIYGDLTKSKFILTFNTDTKTLDKALLRKGRLRVKTEFSRLRGEDLKSIAWSLGFTPTESEMTNGMTLAEIYNYETPDYQDKPKRIGF